MPKKECDILIEHDEKGYYIASVTNVNSFN